MINEIIKKNEKTFMKYLIYSIIILSFLQSNAQTSIKDLNLSELKVGEPMPDIPLGEVTNNNTGKTRFSEFKGKLVILDFWHTYCTTCIEAFPHMSALQREFGDKIQIFLVNYVQTQAQIDSDIRISNGKRFKMPIPVPANLPSITGAKHLEKLFPHHGETGYHVWIDGNGIVRLRGYGGINTYEEKIRDLLAGKEISYVTDAGVGSYNDKIPLYKLIDKSAKPLLRYSSVFAKFDPELGPYYGSKAIDIKDSANGTIRNTYLNYTVFELYENLTRKVRSEEKSIISPVRTRAILLVKDSVKYADERRWYKGPHIDKIYTDNRFSYEQITPLTISEAQRYQYALEDLNRYFGALYGAEGKIETRKMPCWILVRTSREDKLKTKDINHEWEIKVDEINGKKLVKYTNVSFDNFLEDFRQGFLENFSNDYYKPIFLVDDIVINETGYTGNVDMLMPSLAALKSIEELRGYLKPYDMDIIKGEREVKMLVIKETDYKEQK